MKKVCIKIMAAAMIVFFGTAMQASALGSIATTDYPQESTRRYKAEAALATCYTGYTVYSDRFHLAEGLFTEDNTHILLGVLGTIGIATAVAIGNSSSTTHAAIGRVGTAAMLFSIITIRW